MHKLACNTFFDVLTFGCHWLMKRLVLPDRCKHGATLSCDLAQPCKSAKCMWIMFSCQAEGSCEFLNFPRWNEVAVLVSKLRVHQFTSSNIIKACAHVPDLDSIFFVTF